LKASLTTNELEEASRRALEELGCRFYTNRTIQITEYEVIEPVSMIIRITRVSNGPSFTRFGTLFTNILDSSSKREISDLDVVLPEYSTSASQLASEFVRALLGTLSKKPWQGLNLSEGVDAKADWNSWLRRTR